MPWKHHISIELSPDINTATRLGTFYGHFDCRVFLSPGGYVDVGAGSLGVVPRIRHVPPEKQGYLGTIGRFSEAAECDVLYAGEHANQHPVNVVFAMAKIHRQLGLNAGVMMGAASPLSIGNGVVLSAGCRVLPGAKIGDGAVIGASALVRRDIAPFSIVGGVPARWLRDRFSAETREQIAKTRWWDFSSEYLAANMGRLQDLALTDGPHEYRPQRPRLVIFYQGKPEMHQVLGFTDGEGFRPLSEASPGMQQYVAQAEGSGPYYWHADPWTL